MENILEKLKGGDRRSIGRVDEVAADVLKNPILFADLIDGMLHTDPIVRMRSADAVEKISRQFPGWLQPYKVRLINEVAAVPQQEVRWHIAQMFARLELSPDEVQQVLHILEEYLEDDSKIVRTFAMQAMADLAEQREEMKEGVIALLEQAMSTGSPAMRSRGKKLLKNMKR